MFIRVLIYLLLLRSGLAAAEMELTAQRSFVNALAEIWASGGSLLDRQDMGLEDQLIGNQSVSTNSQARSENVSISVESQASFTRSNTAEGIQFWIDAAVRIRSEGDLRMIGTNSLQTKGFGQSDNSIRISSSVPFRYDFRTWPQSPPLLTTLNGFYLTRTGHPVVQLQWDSAATELPRSEGRLPAGEYDIQF
jgi:hypothetical protein